MKKQNKYRFIALITACLFWMAWPMQGITGLIFFAFVPLLFLEDDLYQHSNPRSSKILFNYSFLSFALWNLASTYWIWNASAVGMIIAVLLNAFLMSTVMWAFHYVKIKVNPATANLSFVFFWMAMEYFVLSWDLSWPWMNLGNVFSEQITWVQWYEYTGTFGGTFWILSANMILFLSIKKSVLYKSDWLAQLKNFSAAIALILAPILISLSIYTTYEEKKNPTNIVIVQPNIDPYSEKFSGLSELQQLQKLTRLSDSVAQKNTEFFIWPETALQNNLNERALEENQLIQESRKFLERYKNGSIITGADSYKPYDKKETITARKYRNGECCYDAFNAAFFIENNQNIQVYHKSKLVAGVEQMPYPKLLSFLEPYALKLGGTFGSLGKQDERTVFYTRSGIGVAPVICYESVYGEFVAEYVKNGAQLIAIVTNDGWWGNTPGYKQHASYAALRAIETRRSIARSANTGISSFINQKGEVILATEYWKEDAKNANLNLNDRITFYVRQGDFIAFTSALIAILLFTYAVVIKWLKK